MIGIIEAKDSSSDFLSSYSFPKLYGGEEIISFTELVGIESRLRYESPQRKIASLDES